MTMVSLHRDLQKQVSNIYERVVLERGSIPGSQSSQTGIGSTVDMFIVLGGRIGDFSFRDVRSTSRSADWSQDWDAGRWRSRVGEVKGNYI